MYLYLDIETAPIPNAAEFLSSDDMTPPKNYKDPEKIAVWKVEAVEKRLAKAALDPDLNRIVALAWSVAGRLTCYTAADADEQDALRGFWKAVEGQEVVGYNCLGFDLPTIMRRSTYLGVPYHPLAINRFRHPDVVDLMQVCSFDGALTMRGLDWYCRRFGLDVPADTVTGAAIPGLVEAGDWDAVQAHVVADVKKTVALAERLGYGS